MIDLPVDGSNNVDRLYAFPRKRRTLVLTYRCTMAIQKNTSSRSAQMTAAAALLLKNATKRSSPRLAGPSGVSDTRPEWFKVHASNDNQPTKGGAPRAAKGARSVRT
eukprot:2955026-Pyramimonas_sp.AAC.1